MATCQHSPQTEGALQLKQIINHTHTWIYIYMVNELTANNHDKHLLRSEKPEIYNACYSYTFVCLFFLINTCTVLICYQQTSGNKSTATTSGPHIANIFLTHACMYTHAHTLLLCKTNITSTAENCKY